MLYLASARVKAWWTPALIAGATFICFLPALHNDFVNWDDTQNLVSNTEYRGLGATQLHWMFTTFHLGHYQPLSWVSFAIDYLLWGVEPFGYHLTNLTIHAVAAVLFYFLALRLLSLSLGVGDERVRPAAAVAALFFSLHPLRVESVAWVTERRDVLSGVFLFAAVLVYLAAARGGPKRARYLIGAVLLYALSLLSKASGMTLPIVLAVLDLYPLGRLPASPREWFARPYRTVWFEKIPFLSLAAIFAAIALAAQKQAGAYVPVAAYGMARRLGQAAYATVFYIWKTLGPVRLSPLYQVPFKTGEWAWIFAASTVVVIGLTGIFLWKRKQAPGLLAAWVSYVAFLAPVAGVAQSGAQFVADRYSYLSCLSWAMLAGAAFYKISAADTRRYAVSAVSITILLVLGFASWRQTFVWRDTATLWRHAVAVAPESSIAQYNLGYVQEAAGDFAGAMDHYRRAIALDPADAEARYNLARLLTRMGNIDEAIAEYRSVAGIEPKDADTHNNLALLLLRRGDVAEARLELDRTLEIDPNHARAHFNLGRLFAGEGRLDEAVAHFQRALVKEPSVAEIHENLARALAQQGKKEEAMSHYEEAVRLMRKR